MDSHKKRTPTQHRSYMQQKIQGKKKPISHFLESQVSTLTRSDDLMSFFFSPHSFVFEVENLHDLQLNIIGMVRAFIQSEKLKSSCWLHVTQGGTQTGSHSHWTTLQWGFPDWTNNCLPGVFRSGDSRQQVWLFIYFDSRVTSTIIYFIVGLIKLIKVIYI